jgi:hypothetical protein
MSTAPEPRKTKIPDDGKPEVKPPPFDPCSRKPGDIRLPCCRCVGGEGQTIQINTGSGAGSAPWRVTGPGANNVLAQAITSNVHPYWTATLAPALWVQPNSSSGSTTHPVARYYYDLVIEVPKCTIPMEVMVTGEAAGDDDVQIFLDDMNLPIAKTDITIPSPPHANPGDGGWGFRSERIVKFSGALSAPGLHLLRMEVFNGGGGPHGLLVRAALKTVCSPRLESCCC